jgi:hypothetical protein
MAPAVRGTSTRIAKRQTSVRNNAKTSKTNKLHPAVRSELEATALKPVVVVKKAVNQTTRHVPKRKRDEFLDDSESEPEHALGLSVSTKKVRSFGI